MSQFRNFGHLQDHEVIWIRLVISWKWQEIYGFYLKGWFNWMWLKSVIEDKSNIVTFVPHSADCSIN